MTQAEAIVEVERLVSLANRAIIQGVPNHFALAALETHLVKLIKKVVP
jgi:hypothetical protein